MSTILLDEPVVTTTCREPEGTFERNIYRMSLSPENIQRVYERAKKFRTLFSDEINGDPRKFTETFISEEDGIIRANGLFWVIDDYVGLYYMTHIEEHDARVHYTFFDRRHIGREQLTRDMIKYVFDYFGFRRLTTEIPMYASKHTFDFVINRLGFTKEGRRRQAVEYKGQWFDIMTLGILREEAEVL